MADHIEHRMLPPRAARTRAIAALNQYFNENVEQNKVSQKKMAAKRSKGVSATIERKVDKAQIGETSNKSSVATAKKPSVSEVTKKLITSKTGMKNKAGGKS
jgi:hypothetical protein